MYCNYATVAKEDHTQYNTNHVAHNLPSYVNATGHLKVQQLEYEPCPVYKVRISQSADQDPRISWSGSPNQLVRISQSADQDPESAEWTEDSTQNKKKLSEQILQSTGQLNLANTILIK